MKIKKNQNKIKGEYKQIYSKNIYSNRQFNYNENNEENQKHQDNPEYEDEEQINYQNQSYFKPKMVREEIYEGEKTNEEQSNNQNYCKKESNNENCSHKSNEYNPIKNSNIKNNQYFTEFNNIQKSVELEKKYKFDGKSHKLKENNINQDLKEHQEQEFTPKYYRNNPLVKKGNIHRQKIYMGSREENPLKSVAQKICNIVIKGGQTKMHKNKPNSKINEKKEKEIISSVLTFKKIKFESNENNDIEFENIVDNERNINEFENNESNQSNQNEKELQYEDERNESVQFQNEEYEDEENEGEEIEDEHFEDYEYERQNIEKEGEEQGKAYIHGEGEKFKEVSDENVGEENIQEIKNLKKVQNENYKELNNKEIFKYKITNKNLDIIPKEQNKNNDYIKQYNTMQQKDKSLSNTENQKINDNNKEIIKMDILKDSNIAFKYIDENSITKMQKIQSIQQPRNNRKLDSNFKDDSIKIDKNKISNTVAKGNGQNEKEKKIQDNKNIKSIKKEIHSYKRKTPNSDLNQISKEVEKLKKNNNINNLTVTSKENIIKPEIIIISKSPNKAEHKLLKIKNTNYTKKQIKNTSSTPYIIKNTSNNLNNNKDNQIIEIKNQPKNISVYKSNRLDVSTSNAPKENKKINTSTYIGNRVNINIKKDEPNQEKINKAENRKYKTFTYTSGKQEPLSSGRNYTSIVITSSNIKDNNDKNAINNKGRTNILMPLNIAVNERGISSNISLNKNKQESISNNKINNNAIIANNIKEKTDQNKDKKANNMKTTYTLISLNNKRGVLNSNNLNKKVKKK